MTSSLFHVASDGSFSEMRAAAYQSEDYVQQLLAEHPAVLGADQYRGLEPRRWALISREMAVPDGDVAERRWSLDHLYIDQDAIPTLVEVKLSRDTRSRREVIGQMFDYAANGPSYWSLDSLRRAFEATHRSTSVDADAALRNLLGDEIDPQSFWEKLEENLRAGRIRMIFLVDQMPPELLRIVEFLARQLRDAEVYAVEVRQHVGSTGTVLATSVLGQVQNDERKLTRARDAIAIGEEEWFERFGDNFGGEARVATEMIAAWSNELGLDRFVTKTNNPSLGFRVLENGKYRYPLLITANGKLSISLSYLAYSPAYESDESRQQIADEFKANGFTFNLSSLRGDIRIPMSQVSDRASVDRYLEVLGRLIARFSR